MKASGFLTRNHGRPGKNIGRCLLIDSRGAQIAEFAVALPLLMVFVVGIFDFGLAFGTKQKLANAAREGARVAANQPTTDLSLTPWTIVGSAAPPRYHQRDRSLGRLAPRGVAPAPSP